MGIGMSVVIAPYIYGCHSLCPPASQTAGDQTLCLQRESWIYNADGMTFSQMNPSNMPSVFSLFKVAVCLAIVSLVRASRDCRGLRHDLEETFLLFDPLQRNNNNLVDPGLSDLTQSKTTYLAGRRRCSKRGSSRPVYPGYQADSLCPGHLVLNHNPNRCPESIVEVRCNCHMCRGRISGNCQPVFYPRLIWLFDSDDENATAQPAVHNVTVGCQCIPIATA